jgi:hypothetical protein
MRRLENADRQGGLLDADPKISPDLPGLCGEIAPVAGF